MPGNTNIEMRMKRLFLVILLGFAGLLISFSAANQPPGGTDVFTVVLDAGHGGHDPGNLGNGFLEKNIALNIVLKVGELLQGHTDIKVVYTRKDDRFLDLYVRGEIANKSNADLFISVHCDSHTSDAQGAGTFVLGLHANKQNFEIAKKENSAIYLEDNYEARYAEYDINSPESIIGLTIMQEEFLDQSILLAKLMQDNFVNRLKRNDRKVKQAGFIVLHQTFMPSVLIETGFLTNKSEGLYLNSKKGQSEMGTAIADAVIEYRNSISNPDLGVGPPTGPAVAILDKKDLPAEKPAPGIDEKKIGARSGTADQAVGSTGNQPETKDLAVTGEKVILPEHVEKKPEVLPKESPVGVMLTKNQGATTAGTDDSHIPPASDTPVQSQKVAEKAPEDTASELLVQSDETQAVEKIASESSQIEKKKEIAIEFRVQLLASAQDLPLRAENFKGLGKLSKEPVKNLFRYMYGSTASFSEAKLLQSNAQMKGYATAYIVAYREGIRIPVPVALKYLSE